MVGVQGSGIAHSGPKAYGHTETVVSSAMFAMIVSAEPVGVPSSAGAVLQREGAGGGDHAAGGSGECRLDEGRGARGEGRNRGAVLGQGSQ